MSDSYLRFISENPEFKPDENAVLEAEKELKKRSKSNIDNNISHEYYDQVAFIDCGINLHSVKCPFCDSEILKSWIDLMDKKNETSFANLEIETPCCKRVSSLISLKYDFPCGFASFVLDILYPNFDKNEDFTFLEKILKTKIKKIYAKY